MEIKNGMITILRRICVSKKFHVLIYKQIILWTTREASSVKKKVKSIENAFF